MNTLPIPQAFVNRALKLGITNIILNFSGGSDEGYLYVEFVPSLWNLADEAEAFSRELEEWAYDTYDYNGAGEGIDYGDRYEYDLVKKKMSHQEWYYKRVNGGIKSEELQVESKD